MTPLWFLSFVLLGSWLQVCATVVPASDIEQIVVEDSSGLEPLHDLEKVPGNNPAYFCRYGPQNQLFRVKEFIVLPSPPKPSSQHFIYLTGWAPHVRGLDVTKLSFTIWSKRADQHGPYEYRLSDLPWVFIRENFLIRKYIAPGWSELIAENVLDGTVIEEGLYRVRVELLLPDRRRLLCVVSDIFFQANGTMAV